MFYTVFQVLRRYFREKLEGTATSSYNTCFASVFISADIIFLQLFGTSFNIWKRFLSQIFLFLMDSPKPPPYCRDMLQGALTHINA